MSKKRSPKTQRIKQAGQLCLVSRQHELPEVVLQMPQVFMLDLRKYKNSIQSAQRIEGGNRSQLYDMYESALMDSHLSGVLDKRLRGVTQIPIEFHRDGKVDEVITPQLKSPWFKEVRKEIVMAEFWGFSLMQFYLDDEGNIRADSINRKHYNPITRELLQYQGDQTGTPIEHFENMLFVGKERYLGIFAELLPAVLYKRGNYSDWARFANIFGMPIREYTYDAGDETARKRLIQDAQRQGANAVYIHPKESSLNLIESKNTSASADLYERFADHWDSKISIRILGNTLTTDAKDTGTQALGQVHKEVEDEMNADDRDTILDVLNYYMRPIFSALGFNTEGGEFVYAKKDKIAPTQQADIVLKLHSIGLPIADDYLYEFSGIPKPDNYEEMLRERQEREQAMKQALEGATGHTDPHPKEGNEGSEGSEGNEGDEPKGNKPPKPKNGLRSQLIRFFGLAPQSRGADNDF